MARGTATITVYGIADTMAGIREAIEIIEAVAEADASPDGVGAMARDWLARHPKPDPDA